MTSGQDDSFTRRIDRIAENEADAFYAEHPEIGTVERATMHIPGIGSVDVTAAVRGRLPSRAREDTSPRHITGIIGSTPVGMVEQQDAVQAHLRDVIEESVRRAFAHEDPRARRYPDAVCRGCGCSDSRACDDGCWWVEPGLCSTCAAAEGAARMAAGEMRAAADTDLRAAASWIPLTLEMKADAGWPLTDEEQAELRRRDEDRDRWARSWAGRRRRARYALADGWHRLRHAIAQAIRRAPRPGRRVMAEIRRVNVTTPDDIRARVEEKKRSLEQESDQSDPDGAWAFGIGLLEGLLAWLDEPIRVDAHQDDER